MNESVEVLDLLRGRVDVKLNMRQGRLEPAMKPHIHPHFELLYIINGVRELTMNGHAYKAGPGDLLIFRPGDAHLEYAGTEFVSMFVFRFHPQELAGKGIEFPSLDKTGPVFPLPHKDEFYALFTRMDEEFNRPGEGSQILLGAYLVEFLVKLRRAVKEVIEKQYNGDDDSIHLRVRNAMDIMQKNLSGDLDLKEIAKSAFMSVSHFSHTFKEKTGESPKRFLIRERIDKARKLLAETDKSASEIAEELGYESPYFFYRQFRSKTGMTATQYRESVRKKVHTES